MQFLDLTYGDAACDLALDEALLETAEQAIESTELLRIWEPTSPMVVLGRSSRIAEEVNEAACAARRIPIFRRASGGATIITGPGCLMYALVLNYDLRPGWRLLDQAHSGVMENQVRAIRELGIACSSQGICDLTFENRKFSGNSLRCRRRHLLYHGTILYQFPLDLIAECLGSPQRQPEYRAGRDHRDFVGNLASERASLVAALRKAWSADQPTQHWPRELTLQLAQEKYSQVQWTRRH